MRRSPIRSAKSEQTKSQNFVLDAGSFDQSQVVSVLPGFLDSGVDIHKVKNEHFTCASFEKVPKCLADLTQSGIFGKLRGAMFSEGGDTILYASFWRYRL